MTWLFLTGNRTGIAVGMLGLFAAIVGGLELLGVIPLSDPQPLYYAYSGLIAGNLTLITVIVSINQLFLSRELQTPGELKTEIESISEYREEVETATGEVAPSTPIGFLRLLIESTRQKAQRVGGFARDGVVTAGNEDLDAVVTNITEQMDGIDDRAATADPDTFEILAVMLEANYAERLYELRAIQQKYDDEIGDVAQDAIADLIGRLHDVDVSRQYFRSIYLQEELSSLSRILLLTGLPSVAVSVLTLTLLTGFADSPTPVLDFQLLLPITLTVGMMPLAILCSYFLRTATITQLTAATIPFTTPDDARL